MDPLDLQDAIEDQIREAFENEGLALFWPDRFVAQGLGSADEVLAAMAAMVHARQLVAVVKVYSAGGHLCWEGSPSELATLGAFECAECGERTDDPDAYAVAYFEISDRWRERLASEKKRSRLAS